MLTPQDIQNKEFSKAVFGGYDMSGVDDFLEEIINDYSALFKENAILKGKIKVLVEKVEEYRSTEDAMRMALLTAQKMGDEMVADARQKSDNIVSEAESAAEAKLKEIADSISFEENRLNTARENTKEFVRQSNLLIERQQAFLTKLLEMTPADVPEEPAPEPAPPTPEEREAEILNTAEQIAGNLSRMTEEPAPAQEPEPEPAQPEEPAPLFRADEGEPTKIIGRLGQLPDEEDVSPRPKFDFENLKFGTNYNDGK